MHLRKALISILVVVLVITVICIALWFGLDRLDQAKASKLFGIASIVGFLLAGTTSIGWIISAKHHRDAAGPSFDPRIAQGKKLLQEINRIYTQRGTGIVQMMELLHTYVGRTILLRLRVRSVHQSDDETYSVEGKVNRGLYVVGKIPMNLSQRIVDLEKGHKLLISGIIDGFQEAKTLIMSLRQFSIESPAQYRTPSDETERPEQTRDSRKAAHEPKLTTASLGSTIAVDRAMDMIHDPADRQAEVRSPNRVDPAALHSLLAELLHDSHPSLAYLEPEHPMQAVERLAAFGFYDIDSFKKAMPPVKVLSKYETTSLLALVNMILIIIDEDRFAALCWPEHNRIREDFRRFLRSDGVDTSKFPETDDPQRKAMLLDPAVRDKKSIITVTGLQDFARKRYKETHEKAPENTKALTDVIEEMRRMGIFKLQDLQEVVDKVNPKTKITIQEVPFQSLAGLLRYTLIIWDQKLYFTAGWRQDWNPWAGLKHKTSSLEKDGVDINNIPDEDPEEK